MDFGPLVSLERPAFVHPTARLYGKIAMGPGSSIWINVAMRAEMHEIVIGAHTNVQDFCMIHVGTTTPTIVGDHCSITHHCTIHGCTIGDNCLIGINATVMDGATIGDNSIVAGGAFVREGTEIPPNSIAMGVPAKVVRTRNNWIANRFNAFMYERNAEAYARGEHRAWDDATYLARANDKMRALQAEFADRFGKDAP